MNTEIWRAIAGCNGDYWISDHGRVRSTKYMQTRIMQPAPSGHPTSDDPDNRQQQLLLRIDGKSKAYRIQQLVANAFIGPAPSADHRVRFRDGDRRNCHVDNLRWMAEVDLIRDVEFDLPMPRAWLVQSPTGEKYIVKKPSRFAKAYGLNASSFSSILNRRVEYSRGLPFLRKQVKGWRLVSEFDRVTGHKTYINSELAIA